MTKRQWAIMLISAALSAAGVFLGADVNLDTWGDMNVPRLILGAIVAFLGSVLAFLTDSPR